MTARLQLLPSVLVKYSYGSVQLRLRPKSTQAEILRAMQSVVDKRDLLGKGLEKEHHVTIRYGIIDDETSDLKKYLASLPAFPIEFGETRVFPPTSNSNGAAVLHVQVISSELEALNKELANHAKFKVADFEYHPHMTMAYIDPASTDKYINWPNLAGFKYEVSEVEVCSKDDTKTPECISLLPSGFVTYFGKLLVYIPKNIRIEKFGDLVGRIE